MNPLSSEVHPFWGDEPNVIFRVRDEFFPSEDMGFARKINAITRLILISALVGLFFVPSKVRIGVVTSITLLFLYIYYYAQIKQTKETFITTTQPSMAELEEVFDAPTVNAPMGNVRPADYYKNPPKKPAPPGAFPVVREKMLEQFKTIWASMYPASAMKRIFESREGNYIFEESIRPFYTMASTTIPSNLKEFIERTYPARPTQKMRGQVRGSLYNMTPAEAIKSAN